MNKHNDNTKAAEAAQIVGAMIRQESKEGRLISASEILSRAADQKLFASADTVGEEGMELLRKVVDADENLRELADENGSRSYYSSLFMTEAYARILFHKQAAPLKLIADVVRQNSATYPRPVPLDHFTRHPFDLTLDEVLSRVKQMSALTDYKDIQSTTASTSRVFLYSALYLNSEYARSLAEWLDVGQPNNP
jgi:hypothetical protein